MNLSKKLVAVLSCSILAAACGGGGASDKKDTASSSTSSSAIASDKALELIGANDCTTCHRLTKESSGANTGPAYSEVAEKYSPAADSTVDRLVKKILTGGSGVWGTIPMTPHPGLKPEDAKTMVQYILSLKK